MNRFNKIYYIHGTMYSGKSLDLISTYTTYKYHNKKVLAFKHVKDTRDKGVIKSRMSTQEVKCTTFTDKDNLFDVVSLKRTLDGVNPDVILIDEIQFASNNHILDLHSLSRIAPIMCYGLKTSYTGELFPALSTLIPLAENIREIKTTCCMCNSKATHNLLVRDGSPIYEGAFVNIEGENESDKYYAVCREHFVRPDLVKI